MHSADATLLPLHGNTAPLSDAAADTTPLSDADTAAGPDDMKVASVVSTDPDISALGPLSLFYAHYRIAFHVLFWLIATAWWITALLLHRNDKNWVVPFLLYLSVTLRLLFFHLPASLLSAPLRCAWSNTALLALPLIPHHLRSILGALATLAVVIVGTMASETTANNSRSNRAISIFGLLVFLFCLWATSTNRKAINWQTVIVGMLVQFLIALFVLRTAVGYDIFNFISLLARQLLSFANHGTAFLTDPSVPKIPWFLIGVLPPIIFFIALVQLLYYWGVLQWFIGKFASFFFWTMNVSGAEAVAAAASPFIGQGESAVLIRPFVPHMTKSEIHQIMCSGFATIAGSVLIAYISFGISPQALISSCVMSIPSSLAVSKLRYPETEESLTKGTIVIPHDEEQNKANALHAFADGAWLGLQVAGMILANLLVIIALVALIDGLLGWFGQYFNVPNLSLGLLMGYICYPVAFLLGTPRNELFLVGKLIGTKLIQNEFVAFSMLSKDPDYAHISDRGRIIATYALCGFANLGSLGTQIGVLGQIAPARRADFAKIAFSALVCGAIATLMSACVAGMVVIDEK
ncbi:Solute carrier family 28 member 3 [Neolecta irregularis DAH-3]|uniref:Solute carrier family 28 member 3 n=1 Tax=Neolecta irregularis (strain DAH-3) TaxID=1198029 RepID=A0A1U7LSE4_NEOID|nr:Solute carrier family 28 member 3 [Neolecta irregularis DAH-3]|eukprot:OLL25538.1 Solute carrier family 28 member 3 [Neolecta irregularis DAH-3]